MIYGRGEDTCVSFQSGDASKRIEFSFEKRDLKMQETSSKCCKEQVVRLCAVT